MIIHLIKSKMIGHAFALMSALLLLTGCVTIGGNQSIVCEALIGPIKYNSTNTASARHAGPTLAKDLAQRNRVGINLKCPQY